MDFSHFSFIEVIVSLGGMTGIIALGNEMYRIYMRSRVYDPEMVTEFNFRIYQQLSIIRDKTNCLKSLVILLHNGGNEPQVGKSLYSSATHESGKGGDKSRLDKWNKQPIDSHYSEIMMSLVKSKEGYIDIRTKDLPPSILRNVYITDGISHSRVIKLFVYKPKPFKIFSRFQDNTIGKLWYMSVTWGEDTPMTAEEEDTIRFASNTISKIFEEQYKYD